MAVFFFNFKPAQVANEVARLGSHGAVFVAEEVPDGQVQVLVVDGSVVGLGRTRRLNKRGGKGIQGRGGLRGGEGGVKEEEGQGKEKKRELYIRPTTLFFSLNEVNCKTFAQIQKHENF